jgi:lysophospholipase L1-like esterase
MADKTTQRTDARKLILFTGSSIMALWQSLPDYFRGTPILNTAVSGSQTHEILTRVDELVIVHAPRLVCYYCGSNDISHEVAASVIVANVRATFDTLRRRLPGAGFIYLSIIKAPQKADRWRVVDDVNAQLAGLAERVAGFHFLDINPLFFAADGRPRLDFYVEDQLHLTPAAYAAMGEYVAPLIRAIWDRLP